MRAWVLGALRCALVASSASAVGCEATAPASTDDGRWRAPSAVDWCGVRDLGSGVPARPAAAVPANTWVLHIGDSFVHASLRQNLGPLIRATGSGYVVQAKTATYTTTWASSPELDHWLARRPALVLVTLGANEVEMPDPDLHAVAIGHLAKKIVDAGATCVWITPPMWKRDTGILRVIHDHSAPCLFFDSDAALGGLSQSERQPDHIHPNKAGGARWAQALWRWLGDHRDPEQPGWALLPFEQRGS